MPSKHLVFIDIRKFMYCDCKNSGFALGGVFTHPNIIRMFIKYPSLSQNIFQAITLQSLLDSPVKIK